MRVRYQLHPWLTNGFSHVNKRKKLLNHCEANFFKRLLYCKPLSSFDPRPPENRGNTLQNLPRLQQQTNSTEWFDACEFRITASLFGIVKRLKLELSPKSIVSQVLGIKKLAQTLQCSGVLTIRKRQYRNTQNSSMAMVIAGCSLLQVASTEHPYLGSSPDGSVHDPYVSEPYGFLEVKHRKTKHPSKHVAIPNFAVLSKKGGMWRHQP